MDLISGDSNKIDIFIISRLPRLVALIFTGIGMSISGLIMQKICMNKFVSPTTGSTISFAQLGVLIAFILFKDNTILSKIICSFLVSIIGTTFFVIFTQKIKFKDVVMIPLIGIMFSYIIGGVTNFIAFKYELNQALSTWISPHFSTILKGRYEIMYLVLPLIVLSYLYSNYFNIVGMGKTFSINLGINYNFIIFIGIFISSLITSSIVVIVGSVSYIGLIVPNIVSIYYGDKIKNTIFLNMLIGSIFILICDILSRIIIYPYEIPIDLIIGFIGSILFIILLFYRINNNKIKIFNNKYKNNIIRGEIDE